MSETARAYLPAAGKDWLLPLYDPIVKLFGGDRIRQALIDQAGLRPGQRVLEVGCGTGTLDVMIKRQFPQVEVVGLDPDLKALDRAHRKAARAAVSIQFDQGYADQLPYPGASFDRVFSSFMFHHLPAEEKTGMLRAVRRVLKPDGALHLVDFEGPEDHAHGWFAHLFHSNERLQANSEERVIAFMRECGFRAAHKVTRGRMFSGGVGYFRAEA
ncbi:MAG TPA: class I SAM-dependent methyltransferase [Terriglobales bacterium]|jgi:ubiquinone/menaquinone biosynthesis C-methylase UbiE